MSGYPTGIKSVKGRPAWVALAALVLVGSTLLSSCKKNEYPKPIAYPRIDYPKAQYQAFEPTMPPVSFEYPTYATLDTVKPDTKNWINLHFIPYRATLHMSYIATTPDKAEKRIQGREALAFEQAPPGCTVYKKEFEATNKRFTGYFYLTDGNTPCPIQFILTNHNGLLFDGSLVFSGPVNQDSLALVIHGMTRDVQHLVESFQFKN